MTDQSSRFPLSLSAVMDKQKLPSSLGAELQQQIKRSPMSQAYEAARKAMVAKLVAQGIQDSKVLTAMKQVPRHLFVEQALMSQAYIDAALPIGHYQTISQPYIVARMMEIVRGNSKDELLECVLEIGTGCGYQAAALSKIAKEVYSIERIHALYELAKKNLRPLKIANLRLHYGDGCLGLPQAAPFKGIILAAAGLEVPQALLEQMAIGGRLVAPVGGQQQRLQLIERVSESQWMTSAFEACRFVPLNAGTVPRICGPKDSSQKNHIPLQNP